MSRSVLEGVLGMRGVAGVSMLAMAMSGAAQQAGGAAKPATAPATTQLSVVITDKAGHPVPGLPESAFRVLDDHQAARVVGFRAPKSLGTLKDVDPSTEVVIILDEVDAPYDRATYARLGIESFLRQNGGQLQIPVSLGIYTERGLDLQQQPSTDGTAMAAALEKRGNAWRMMDKGTGFYGAEQRLKFGQDALDSLIATERTKPWHKLVVWVSGGWPLMDAAQVDVTDRQREKIFTSVQRLNQGLAAAHITMYSIDPLGNGGDEQGYGGAGAHNQYYLNFVEPVRKPAQATFGDLALQVLSLQTGGRAVFGNDLIQNSLNRVVGELRGTYVLTVELPPQESGSTFRAIEVQTDRAGLVPRTRDGYYVAAP